ncbi:MAG TPA: OsmC family protein [Thermoanaerobaculia bacterium]|nr:OsmC family protein [Thermoanaerobaculia bacterium]
MRSEPLRFPSASGATTAALFDSPLGTPAAYALIAHAGSAGAAAESLSRALVGRGMAVLRVPVGEIGEGEAALPAAVVDLLAAVAFLRRTRAAPLLLAGHGLGGAAVLAAAVGTDEARAVAVLGCPAGEIPEAALAALHRPLLFLHSPADQVVAIDQAQRLYEAAGPPKSFLSLGMADHLLSDPQDARFAGEMLAAWAARYVEAAPEAGVVPGTVEVRGAARGFEQEVVAGHHRLAVDEPVSFGGGDAGPNPYELLLASLGACTAMTLRIYAEREKLPLRGVRVKLRHSRIHAVDCATCQTQEGRITRIEREIELDGPLDPAQRQLLLAVADRCPVHRTLASEIDIQTRLA